MYRALFAVSAFCLTEARRYLVRRNKRRQGGWHSSPFYVPLAVICKRLPCVGHLQKHVSVLGFFGLACELQAFSSVFSIIGSFVHRSPPFFLF